MKCYLPSFVTMTVGVVLGVVTTSHVVKANCLPLSSFCENAGKMFEGVSEFCEALFDPDFGNIANKLSNGEDYTIFAPTNEAYEYLGKITSEKERSDKEINEILSSHVIQGKKYLPADLLCDSFADVLLTDEDSKYS